MQNGETTARAVGRLWPAAAILLAAVMLAMGVPARGDEVLLKDGRQFTGAITRQTEHLVEIRTEDGQLKSFPMSRVREVSSGDGGAVEHQPDANRQPPDDPAETPTDQRPRSRGEVLALIDKAGKSKPDWWDQTQLIIPEGLDLAWNKPDRTPWNANRWMEHYLRDRVNPNEAKWRHGVKLLHHTLTLNKDDPAKLFKSMTALARLYQLLLEDYARAGYWWQRASAISPLNHFANVMQAECYFRLGSKAMAVAELRKDRQFSARTIKLYAEMGDLTHALALAEKLAARYPMAAYFIAGDACRRAGDYDKALGFYRRVLDNPKNDKNLQRLKTRAQANFDAIQMFSRFDPGKVPDGKYTATAPAYAGPLTVEIQVAAGRITEVRIVKHTEKQYYSAMNAVPRQIVEKQTVKSIDTVASATITSEAIINATAKAISAAAR